MSTVVGGVDRMMASSRYPVSFSRCFGGSVRV